MTRYFDKTFFRFLLGFIAILAISFSIIFIANYYWISDRSSTAMEFVSDDECLTDGDC